VVRRPGRPWPACTGAGTAALTFPGAGQGAGGYDPVTCTLFLYRCDIEEVAWKAMRWLRC
jgi:hypothetical protein